MCQAGTLGREVLDLAVVFIPVRSKKLLHPRLALVLTAPLSCPSPQLTCVSRSNVSLSLPVHMNDPQAQTGGRQALDLPPSSRSHVLFLSLSMVNSLHVSKHALSGL